MFVLFYVNLCGLIALAADVDAGCGIVAVDSDTLQVIQLVGRVIVVADDIFYAGEVSALDIHELTPDGMEIIIELGVCRYDQFGTVVERGVE